MTGDDEACALPRVDIEALGHKVLAIKNEADIDKKLDLILDMELTSIQCSCQVRDYIQKKEEKDAIWKIRMALTVGGVTTTVIALAGVLYWLIQIHVGG